jgi:hypothetical protein
MSQKIAAEYLNGTLSVEPGNRLHRLVALLSGCTGSSRCFLTLGTTT